jgi:adenosylhomocysteine nucleosidase
MRLLLVASDAMEFRGILAHSESARRTSIGADWSRTGKVNGNDVLLVANGVGRRRAAAAVDAASTVFPADHVVSTGFCGALDPSLRLSDLVVAGCVASGARRYSAAPVTGRLPATTGTVSSIDRVAATAVEKQALYSQGAIAVEMEAAGVAERAGSLGLPFSCVKVVTDLAGEDMANDFNKALRSDGHFATMHIFRDSLRHPGTRIPELIRLQQRCARAARILGDFFADCRF